MDLKRLGKNYLYNLALNVLNTLYPLIVLPYVTRILGPDNLGKVNFAQNFVSYFILVSTFGLQIYGVREIAKTRQEGRSLDKTYAELFCISLLCSFIAVIAYVTVVASFSRFSDDRLLFLLFTLPLLLNGISVDWFFSGIEHFGYITARNAVFKLGSLPFLFLFVHSGSDYIAFALITIGATNGSALVNILGVRRFVKPAYREMEIGRHLGSLAIFFVITLVSSFAVSLPVTFLGFLGTDSDVALFTLAYKTVLVVLSVINALSVVLLPRLTMLAQNDERQFDAVAKKIASVVNAFALPAAVGVFTLSDRIVFLLGGSGFADAALALQAMSIVIVVSANSSFLVGQILYPRKRETSVLACLIATATTAAIVDFGAIKLFGFPGSVGGYLTAECFYLALLVVVAYRYKLFRYDLLEIARCAAYSLFMGGVVWLVDKALPRGIAYLALPIAAGVIAYGACLWVFKEPLLRQAIKSIASMRARKGSKIP